MRGCDSHFIMQVIGKFGQNIDVIPYNFENIWLSCLLVFVDDFQFMSNTLEIPVNNLPSESFKYTLQKFQSTEFEMKQKGVYPYVYRNHSPNLKKHNYQIKKDFIVA